MVKWAKAIEEHFKFTYKLWRGITHAKELVFDPDDVFTFIKHVIGAVDKVLSEYAHYMVERLHESKEVYVYFNNTAGDALRDHAKFLSCLSTLKRE